MVTEQNIQKFSEQCKNIFEQIGRDVIGQKEVIEGAVIAMIAGGNDSGAIHISRGGVRTIAVSVPCRYIHSPSCVINKEDFENTLILTRELAKRIHEL